ncbi:MAG TPA: hypothetical protein VF543_03120 [Pyrinomonadaceae bacterium]|jgi:hypothetical protein
MKTKPLLSAIGLCLSPILLCALITIIGLAIHSIPLISGAGLALFFILFHLFAFADRIIKFAESIRSKHKDFLRGRTDVAKAFTGIINTVGTLPLQAGIMIRAILLSSSIWIVGLYESLAEGGIHQTVDDWRFNLAQTMLSMSLGVIDSVRGKTIERPGWATRVLSIWGYFQFLRGLIILFCGIQGREALFTMRDFLSHPLWFMDPWVRSDMLRFAVGMGLGGTALVFLLLPIMGLTAGLRGLSSKIADAQNFSISMIVMSLWFLSLAVYEIYIIFNHTR